MAVEERPRPSRVPEVGMSRMLVTKHFLFLHVPRTGGQFLRGLCYRHLPPESLVPNVFGPHRGYAEVAGAFPDLPMFCCVRNPWDWYVSSYHFVVQNAEQGRGPMWRSAFESGKADFKHVITRACTGEDFDNPRTAPVMAERGLDHYSALFWITAGEGIEAGRVEAGKLESVADDFVAFLERHEIPIPEGLRHDLHEAPPYGATRRGHYRDYYDDELRELVARRAAGLISDYGYSF